MFKNISSDHELKSVNLGSILHKEEKLQKSHKTMSMRNHLLPDILKYIRIRKKN